MSWLTGLYDPDKSGWIQGAKSRGGTATSGKKSGGGNKLIWPYGGNADPQYYKPGSGNPNLNPSVGLAAFGWGGKNRGSSGGGSSGGGEDGPYNPTNNYVDDSYRWDKYAGGLHPGISDSVSLYLREINNERLRRLAAQEAALGELRDVQDVRQQSYDNWINDVGRSQAMDQLLARTMPDYDVISDAQVNTQRQALAQSHATQDAAFAARAAGSGATGGAEGHRAAQTGAYYSSQGLMMRAQADANNERARSEALSAYTQLSLAEEQVTRGYNTDMERLAATIANVETDLEFEPIDFTAFGQLDFALDAYDNALAQAAADREFAEGQAQWNFSDFVEGAFSLLAMLYG